ncbi:MAG: MarR family winged helix-turn-helix transcriptional regulator [Proteobacteria bacterium]|nr:MarR family winged helix-turn-helix transcriptional regulator [Pseudomonadota bacterium]
MFRRCIQAGGGLFEEACAEFGLTSRQFDVLFVVDACEEVEQDRLARILGLDRSTAGLVVGILERKELIARTVNPKDRRKRLLVLTAAGRNIFKLAKPIATEAADSLLLPLSKNEQEQLFALLQKIINASNATNRVPMDHETIAGGL